MGDVPIVGYLIKSDAFQRSESEVLIMITPYLVQPFAQNQSATASLSVPPQTAMATVTGPEENYGAILPDEDAPLNLPAEDITQVKAVLPTHKPSSLETDKIYKSDFFSDNIRHVYGQDAPENLMFEDTDFGYVLD